MWKKKSGLCFLSPPLDKHTNKQAYTEAEAVSAESKDPALGL